jgi:hypothetical protein
MDDTDRMSFNEGDSELEINVDFYAPRKIRHLVRQSVRPFFFVRDITLKQQEVST